MKVIKWISEKESEGKKESIGGMGGWFNFKETGLRWKDYIEIWQDIAKPYAGAIRESVVKNKLRLTGNDHQYSGSGVPLFEDDTIGSFSFRGWGDIMAAIWSEEENKDYNYMDFYM